MDIYFNLLLIFGIIIMFILLKFSANIFIYVGLLTVSVTGLILTVVSPLYLVTGTNTTIIYSGGQMVGALSEPIKQTLTTYNYIFVLFYLMALLVSVIYWTLENPKPQDY
jgi:hypothetical protein